MSKSVKSTRWAVFLGVLVLLIVGGIEIQKQVAERAWLAAAAEWEKELLRAVPEDKHKTVMDLLKNGANAKDKQDWTLLHYAARYGVTAAAEALLKHGADANAKAIHNSVPLHWAAESDASAIVVVLLKMGADANAKTYSGWTPLHSAANHDASASAEVLLKHGANANAKDERGSTPLHKAAFFNAPTSCGGLAQDGCRRQRQRRRGQDAAALYGMV